MPPDPGRNLSSSERSRTAVADIGHVAPDFTPVRHVNTLVIRPTYRLTLRLGNIEDLFPNAPNTQAGRMERMQVLGLFYFPLGHSQRNTAFGPCWNHFSNVILPAGTNADNAIQDWLKNRVIDTGRFPQPADDAANPQAANFGMIRQPGGYTWFNAVAGLQPDPNLDANFPELAFGQNAHSAESSFTDTARSGNTVLGKIPLVVKVEKRNESSGDWEPVRDAWVYFQLQRPYDLPANHVLNRPALRDWNLASPTAAHHNAGAGVGPKKLNDSEEARNANAQDPQVNNAHRDRGGKRGHGGLGLGTDVDNVIFRTQSTPGFNTAHGARPLSHTAYPLALRATPAGQSHRHAVKAKTNSDGETGVIFMPSRCGGDRYRLRAYIGPGTLASDGTGARAVRVDTGTLVNWRNIRISRVIRQPANNVEAASLLAQAAAAPYAIANQTAYLRSAGVVDSTNTNVGLPNLNFTRVGNGTTSFDGLRQAYQKAFTEIEFDTAAEANAPQALTAADWTRGVQNAIADGNLGMVAHGIQDGAGLRLDLALWLCTDLAAINQNNALCHLPMRTPQAYDAAVAARVAAGGANAMRFNFGSAAWNALAVPAGGGAGLPPLQILFWAYLIPGFLRGVSANGHLPGLTLIHGAFGATWQVLRLLPRSSGFGGWYRSCAIWLGNDAYPRVTPGTPNALQVPQPAGKGSYDFTCNCCHEMGHMLFRQHAPGNPAASRIVPARHDPHADNVCVMSYQDCEGQFCAKCLFALRGWNMVPMTAV